MVYPQAKQQSLPHFQIHRRHSSANTKVTWSSQTKQPDPYQHKKPAGFQLGMDLVYRDGQGKNLPVFCEGASADGLPHTVRLEYGTKLTFHNSNPQLLDQTNFSKMPKTPLDYRSEVGTGLPWKKRKFYQDRFPHLNSNKS